MKKYLTGLDACCWGGACLAGFVLFCIGMVKLFCWAASPQGIVFLLGWLVGTVALGCLLRLGFALTHTKPLE
jgi:hypothetical protein